MLPLRKAVQRRKLRLQGRLGRRQTLRARRFDDLYPITTRALDLRWTAWQPCLKGVDEQQTVDTAIPTSHDACEHRRSPLLIAQGARYKV